MIADFGHRVRTTIHRFGPQAYLIMNIRRLPSIRFIGLACSLMFCEMPLPATPITSRAAFHWTALPALPDPVGFAGMYAGASGGALVAAGGTNFPERPFAKGGKKIWHDRIFILSGPDGHWREAGRLPRPSAYGVSSTWRDAVVCAGGCDAKTNFSSAWLMRWNGQVMVVESLPALPLPIADACGAVVGDTFYVIGGQERPDSTSALIRMFSLDLARPPSGRRWEEKPWPVDAPGRIYAVAGTHQGELFLFSGCELAIDAAGKIGTRELKDAYAFKPGRGWRRLADMPNAAASAPSPAVEIDPAHLLIAVPLDTAARPSGPTPAYLEYESATNTWRVSFRDPADCAVGAACFDTPMVPWQGRFAMISGEIAAGLRTPAVLSLEAARPDGVPVGIPKHTG